MTVTGISSGLWPGNRSRIFTPCITIDRDDAGPAPSLTNLLQTRADTITPNFTSLALTFAQTGLPARH